MNRLPRLPCTIQCPRCPRRVWCSKVDPDAGLSEMWRHLLVEHAEGLIGASARNCADALLAQVQVVPNV